MKTNGGWSGAWMQLEYADELKPLSETDAVQDTLYADYMRHATYPDGSEAFVTFYSDSMGADETGGDPTYAERALVAERFFENIGLEHMVPEHYFDDVPDDITTDAAYYLAVEAVDGEEISVEHKPCTWHLTPDDDSRRAVDRVGALHVQRVSDGRAATVGRDDYLTFAAATLLSGNSDMKGENVMVEASGTLVGIDLDHAGGDFTQHYETAEPWPESHYERGIRLLESNANVLGLNVRQHDIEHATHQLAEKLGAVDGYAVDGIENSAFTDHDAYQYRDNILKNIDAFSAGRFPD